MAQQNTDLSLREGFLSPDLLQPDFFKQQEETRPELNLAKFASFIFVSSRSRDLGKSRKHAWTVETNGKEMQASILVEPVAGGKTPTSRTYKVLLALVQIWEQSGKPENGKIQFSGVQVCRLLNWKPAGKNLKAVEENIEILQGTMLTWEWAFETIADVVEPDQKSPRRSREKLVKKMHILGDGTAYIGKNLRLDGEQYAALHEVQFGDYVLDNLLAGVTKPINYQTFIAIKDPTAAVLYTLLDVVLAKRRLWRRRAHNLIREDLKLHGARYQQKKIRHAKLKELERALDGKELSNGKLAISIEPTADGHDYNLVAERVPRIVKSRAPRKLANPKEDIDDIAAMLCGELRSISPQSPPTENTMRVCAKWYPKGMLLDTLSVVKGDYRDRGTIKKSAVRVFMMELHRLAHQRRFDWINDCGSNCRYRPENEAPLFSNKSTKRG